MPDQAATTRAAAIEGFAAELRALRASAGTPSFRELSGRSKAISHTTLHEAAQGNRLPSWSTTVEFVRACGGDPSEFRARWDDANRAVRAGNGSTAAPQPAPDEDLPVLDPPEPRRHRRLLLVAASAVVLAAIGTTIGVVVAAGDSSPPPATRKDAAQLSSGDCPVRQPNPSPAAPRHAGDAAAFIADISLPDCSPLPAGTTQRKTWRFKNIGTVPWVGYSMHRIEAPQNRDQCQTVSDVSIPPTQPGDLVDISVEVTAPPHPAFCFVRFKMQDATGAVAFPGSRPVNFQVVVR